MIFDFDIFDMNVSKLMYRQCESDGRAWGYRQRNIYLLFIQSLRLNLCSAHMKIIIVTTKAYKSNISGFMIILRLIALNAIVDVDCLISIYEGFGYHLWFVM